MWKISDEQFDRIRRLSLVVTGIGLAGRHRELLSSRCRGLRIFDPAGLDAVLDASEAGDLQARQKLIGLLTTTYTGFFRNPWHFEIAAGHALAAVHSRGRARVWSAGAATGEEPYSLAMALLEAAADDALPVAILATDVNSAALDFARRGEYGDLALRSLSPERRERFFTGTGAAGGWRISGAVRRLVSFEQLNLNSQRWPDQGPFDVIFCRNVLMYLETSYRYSIFEMMASVMAPDALLILDPAEHPGEARALFGAGDRGVYPKAPRRLPLGEE